MVSHIFCIMCGCKVSGVRFREADTYPLVFSCRGGGWYVMCAKSVAVTWLCAHCFDKNVVFSLSR